MLDGTIRNLYVDWGDTKGEILENNVYLASDGAVPSQFVIPENYKDQEIYLNAFTQNTSQKSTENLHVKLKVKWFMVIQI